MSKALRAEGICKAYRVGGRTLEILRDVSFEVRPSEMVAFTGPSGVGKTTLLHLIGTLDRPDAGEIYYGDVAQSSLRGSKLAAFRNVGIGFVFQFFQLLPEFTALENVMMPLLIAASGASRARRRAREVLGGWLSHFPNLLSGGELLRAAIARALVGGPRLLLADEPTGNLDKATGARVFALLRGLQRQRGLTSIIVTHNMEIASQCDRVLSLEELAVTGEAGSQ